MLFNAIFKFYNKPSLLPIASSACYIILLSQRNAIYLLLRLESRAISNGFLLRFEHKWPVIILRFVSFLEGRESPQHPEVLPNECRQRSTISAGSNGTHQVEGCACGPDGLLSCLEQGAHSSLINVAESVKA